MSTAPLHRAFAQPQFNVPPLIAARRRFEGPVAEIHAGDRGTHMTLRAPGSGNTAPRTMKCSGDDYCGWAPELPLRHFFFGPKKVWVGDVKVPVTPESIDCLRRIGAVQRSDGDYGIASYPMPYYDGRYEPY